MTEDGATYPVEGMMKRDPEERVLSTDEPYPLGVVDSVDSALRAIHELGGTNIEISAHPFAETGQQVFVRKWGEEEALRPLVEEMLKASPNRQVLIMQRKLSSTY